MEKGVPKVPPPAVTPTQANRLGVRGPREGRPESTEGGEKWVTPDPSARSHPVGTPAPLPSSDAPPAPPLGKCPPATTWSHTKGPTAGAAQSVTAGGQGAPTEGEEGGETLGKDAGVPAATSRDTRVCRQAGGGRQAHSLHPQNSPGTVQRSDRKCSNEARMVAAFTAFFTFFMTFFCALAALAAFSAAALASARSFKARSE